jgi:hypothetical protein
MSFVDTTGTPLEDWTQMINKEPSTSFEIIRVASPTNIKIKGACNLNFIGVIRYEY